jgi:hypothetical protein
MSKTIKISCLAAAVAFLGFGLRWIQMKRTQVLPETCNARLRDIDRLKQHWALQTQKGLGDSPTWNELLRHEHAAGNHWYDHRNVCPQGGGVYVLGTVGELPKCSIREHKLE